MLIANIRLATQGIHQLARQTLTLATGLQNAAPPGTSLQSVQYLLETTAQLEQACLQIEKILQTEPPRHDE